MPTPTWSNFSCIKPTIQFYDVTIYEPALIPPIVEGMVVGWSSWAHMRKMKPALGSSIYSTTFFFFGFMNFFALFADCLAKSGWIGAGKDTPSWSIATALLDGVCSSLVNVSLIMLGMVDVGILKEGSCFFKFFTSAVYSSIVVGWYLVFHGLWNTGFLFLYMTLGEYGFVSFPIFALIFLVKYHKKVFWRGLFWVVVAVVVGALGFWTLMNGQWICQHSSYYLNTEFWWFLESFTSVFAVAAYFFATINARIPDDNCSQQLLDEEEQQTSSPFVGNQDGIQGPTYIPLQQIQLAPNGIVPPPLQTSGLYADQNTVYLPLQYTYLPPSFPQQQQ